MDFGVSGGRKRPKKPSLATMHSLQENPHKFPFCREKAVRPRDKLGGGSEKRFLVVFYTLMKPEFGSPMIGASSSMTTASSAAWVTLPTAREVVFPPNIMATVSLKRARVVLLNSLVEVERKIFPCLSSSPLQVSAIFFLPPTSNSQKCGWCSGCVNGGSGYSIGFWISGCCTARGVPSCVR